MSLEIENIRRDYNVGSLSKNDMPADPLIKCDEWIQEAIALKVIEPTAIVVATCDTKGQPSTRTVLLKELQGGKFIFYTNYDSRKGQQIAENPNVSITFLWHQLERQIHIEGICQRVAPDISDAYYHKRPYKSRIGARISPQSHPIPNRLFIVSEFAKEALKHPFDPPRPDNWGGYEVTPRRIEFWQGRESRLHDRFVYELQDSGVWILDRVAP